MVVTESRRDMDLEDIFTEAQKFLSSMKPIKEEVDFSENFQNTVTVEVLRHILCL